MKACYQYEEPGKNYSKQRKKKQALTTCFEKEHGLVLGTDRRQRKLDQSKMGSDHVI